MGGFFRRGLPAAAAAPLAAVAALAAVASLAAALTGCAGDAGASLADEVGDPTTETPGGPGLPAGVVPPSGDPQPGDARLGPDGYYDYTADDFVLQNPCDGLPFELAREQGFRIGDNASPRDDETDYTVCRLFSDRTHEAIALASYSLGQPGFEELGYEVSIEEAGGRSWYTVVMPGLLTEQCFAGVDTPDGSFGAGMTIGGFSPYTTEQSACDVASEFFNRIYGGNDEYSGSAI